MRTRTNAAGRLRAAPAPTDGEWLTVAEAAARMHCGRTKVFGLIRDGALPSVKVGRARVLKRDDVDGYLHTLRDAAT